ncbi:B12-binding domain-containing radical SAM protein [Candidatus Omnitrophota bacterium]
MGLKLALFNIADFNSASRFSSLGLAYITAYLRKYSNLKDIYILEGNVASKLKKIKPDVIGIFSVTQTFKEACQAARSIKAERPNIPIIIGGYHITALPHMLADVFDVAVLGEGEETMKQLLGVIAKYGIRPDKLSALEGIAFHNGDKTIITRPREFIKDLDCIPYPARDLLIDTRFCSIITSRGCFYKCIFCSSAGFWGAPRFHSSGYVVNEIEELIVKFGVAHISIWDDLFVANRGRLEAICSLIDKKKINKKVSFGCALRSDLVTPELCVLMKRMNIDRVSIGFESGSQKILSMLKCSSVSVQQHIEAVKLCKANKIGVTGTFMIGNPGEKKDDLDKTLELIKQLKLDGGGTISLAAPLPGTALWEYARQQEKVSDDMDFTKVGIMNTDFSDPRGFQGVLLTDEIPKDEFFQIASQIQKETNKYYIKGLLRWRNISLRNLRFILSRPKEVAAIIRFVIRYLIGKASIMERYVFYYKNRNS